MRHVSELTTLPQPEPSEPTPKNERSTPRPSALTDEHIARLWIRMARMFGHKWISAYGETDDGTWLKGLSDLTPEQIAHGIGECLKQRDPWPPTLPEFRAMAKPNTPAYHKPFPKLLEQERHQEVAERELAKMKTIVRPEDDQSTAERQALQEEGAKHDA